MGVIFHQLGVVGAGGIKLMIRTFPKAVMSLFLFPIFFVMMRLPRFRPTAKQILHSFTGCVKPGELCLVLGRPNSGCSTFLKVIANQRFGYHRVEGEVSYGGIKAEEMAKRYRGELSTIYVYQCMPSSSSSNKKKETQKLILHDLTSLC